MKTTLEVINRMQADGIIGNYVIGGWPVRFLPSGNALVEEAVAQAAATDVEGVPTRVMTAEHLTAIALQTGRAKDAARILQFLESGTLDADKPTGFCSGMDWLPNGTGSAIDLGRRNESTGCGKFWKARRASESGSPRCPLPRR